MGVNWEQSNKYTTFAPHGRFEEWTTRDAYLTKISEEDRDAVYCDHCRSTLVVRPFLYGGELYMECQVCEFTYKNNGVIKEILKAYSG